MSSMTRSRSEKRELARMWVNGYTATGTALVIAVCHVPGVATGVCVTIEGVMCYQIGKIYRGTDYSMSDATAAAASIGLASLVGTIAAIEASSLLGPIGWPVKGPLTAGLIKALGELVIKYYESMDDP